MGCEVGVLSSDYILSQEWIHPLYVDNPQLRLPLTGATVMSEVVPKSSIEVGVGGGALLQKVSPPPASNEAVKVFSLAPHPPCFPSPTPSRIQIARTYIILIISHWVSFSHFSLLILLINTVLAKPPFYSF